MREFELNLPMMPLRPTEDSGKNKDWSTECFNFRAIKKGIESYTRQVDPFAVDEVFPFPQLLVGMNKSFLVVRDALLLTDTVYEIGPGYAIASITSVAPGNRFDYADYGSYIVMTNGDVTIEYDVGTSTYTVSGATATFPLVSTLCDFNGQLIAGDVLSPWQGCDENSIIWGKIGAVDFTPDLKNTAGFRRFPYDGGVYKVRKLGGKVIVYGAQGVGALLPVTSPAPTFGFAELGNVGLASRNAVGCGREAHIFVDQEGKLWAVKEGLELIGYQEFLETMTLSNISISYNPISEDFYISDGVQCFLFNQNGLTQIHQLISSCGVVEGVVIATGQTLLDVEARYVTDEFDMRVRGHKTTTLLEVGFSGTASAYAAMDTRFDHADPFSRTGWIDINTQGVASVVAGGTEFRACFKSLNYSDLDVDYITVRYKLTDMRSIRGVYAPPPRGQGGAYAE